MLSETISTKEKYVFLLILLIGISFRLWTTTWEPSITSPDSAQYLHLASEIKDGAYFQSDYDLNDGLILSRRLAPLYSFIVAAASFFMPLSIEYVGIIVSLFMSILVFFPFYILARYTYSVSSAVTALTIIAIHPFILRWASPSLTEATFALFFVSAILLGALAAEKKTYSLNILFGLIAGLAFLTRETGLSLVVFQTIWLLLYYLLIDRLPWRKGLLLIASMYLAFLLVSAPHFVNVKNRTGNWAISSRRASVESIVNDFQNFGGDRFERDRVPVEKIDPNTVVADDLPANNSLVFVRKMFVNGLSYTVELNKSVGWAVTLMSFLAILAGLFVAWRKRLWRILIKEIYLPAVIVYIIAFHGLITPYMVDGRYMYPVAFLLILLSGIGVARFLEISSHMRIFSFQQSRLFIPVVSSCFVLLIFFNNFGELKTIRLRKEYPYSSWAGGHKEIAQELLKRGLVEEGVSVISRKPYVAYYVKGKPLLLPKTLDQLYKMYKDGQGDILIADSAVLTRKRPLLVDLVWGNYQPFAGHIIFSQRMPKYRRIITVYDLRTSNSVNNALSEDLDAEVADALDLFQNGELLNAARKSQLILEKEPDNLLANQILAGSYAQYYLTTGIPNFLIETIAYYENYLSLGPNDQQAEQVYGYLKQLSSQ